ncbi:cold-regulated protein 27 [Euphorbia lathyris]|uniref:cold-regulated protein 27 n=1 Tax=Euphorbia lathyris TaxID=212925 RepID=UPI0033137A79
MQGQNLRRNLSYPSPDHVAMEAGCVRNLTRTDSFYSSDITAEDCLAPGASTMWTDEKHSLYLDSLEASFVNHLNNPITLRGCLREILWSHRAMPTNSSASVHQDVKRQKTNPQKNNLLLESTADSHIIPEKQYEHRVTSSVKRSIGACNDQDVASSERLHARENSPVCSAQSSPQHSIEVSDQNFVEVGQGERSKCRPRVKRLKRAVADDSGSDQVVPCRNPSTNYASTSPQAFSIKEEQTNQDLQLDNLDNCPKPEV